MKAKVLKKYRDRITKEIAEKGTIVELSEERFAEISEKGFVKKVTERKTTKK